MINKKTIMHFLPFYVIMLVSGGIVFSQSPVLNGKEMPKRITMYANDIELLTLFRVSPTIFDEQIKKGNIVPISITDTSVIKKIIQSISEKNRKCETAPIDVRGLLILNYEEQDIKIYYNMSYFLINESIYQMPVKSSYYLDSIRSNWEYGKH